MVKHTYRLSLRRQRQEEEKEVQGHPHSSLGSVWLHEDLSQKNTPRRDLLNWFPWAEAAWFLHGLSAYWRAREHSTCSVEEAGRLRTREARGAAPVRG